jgi:hypothetical protein
VLTCKIVPRRSANEVSLLSLPTSTSAGKTRVAHVLGQEVDTAALEASCPPVVSSATPERSSPERELSG